MYIPSSSPSPSFDNPVSSRSGGPLDVRIDALRERQRHVLVVDDEPLLVNGLRRSLRRLGHHVSCATNAREALAALEEGPPPDVIITDQRMPGMRGSDLLAQVRARYPDVVRVCMSGHADRPEILDAINDGNVYRFLSKPWDVATFEETLAAALAQSDLIRESHLLQDVAEEQNQHLRTMNSQLEHSLDERTRALIQQTERLDSALLETVRALAYTIEAKDAYTAGHSELVSRFAVALGEKIGLPSDDLECLRLGGILHDVGKIAVPDSVLLKPGRLTDAEYAAIQEHPTVGYRILRDIQFPYDILPIVRSHHERWDGGGYPDRLVGDETPLLARIIHVVDVYEAVTARRVYRTPMPEERVIDLYQRGRGTDFDPQLVEPFLSLIQDGTFDDIRRASGLDIKQEVGTLTFRRPPAVELRAD